MFGGCQIIQFSRYGSPNLQVFQKEEIEPLQVKQQDVNWLGQGLIQSAAANTCTQGLERDLDDASARWKTLNKKVVSRFFQLLRKGSLSTLMTSRRICTS